MEEVIAITPKNKQWGSQKDAFKIIAAQNDPAAKESSAPLIPIIPPATE
jgi:hypothetical protein